MSNPVYLGLSILDISKSKMCKFQYDYLIPKHNEKAKLCYTDTDSFIVHVKTEDIYKDTSDYEADIPTLPMEKIKLLV